VTDQQLRDHARLLGLLYRAALAPFVGELGPMLIRITNAGTFAGINPLWVVATWRNDNKRRAVLLIPCKNGGTRVQLKEID
jgi:hypothetical protein